MPPLVAIIVLSFNGRADTLACLQSLRCLDYPSCRIIVVDNASSDGSAQAVRDAFPDVQVIECQHNLGFTGGNNLGLEHASGAEYALLLNNDTEVAPDFISRLVNVCEADPAIGMAGPTIYYHSQPNTIWSAGGTIHWQRGETSMMNMAEEDRGQLGTDPRPMDFITGCALLARMSAIARVGRLDDRFFAYYEETEWCVRTTRAGYKIVHAPEAKIWHKITPQAREASPQVHYYMTRNRLLFLRLTHAPWITFLRTLSANARTLVSWTLRPRWQHKKAQRRAMWRALADFARGRFGRVDVTA